MINSIARADSFDDYFFSSSPCSREIEQIDQSHVYVKRTDVVMIGVT